MKISNEARIVSFIGLFFLVIIGFLFWKAPQANNVDINTETKDVKVEVDDHMIGNKDAKVIVVEFGDYECPGCGYVAPFLKQLVDSYKDNPNFSFVFKHYPLPQHPNALIAAEAAEAAGAQGKFWEMHEMLYAKQSEWSESKEALSIFAGYAQSLGLDIEKFKQDVSQNKFAEKINLDKKAGDDILLNHTPDVYINGKEATNLDPKILKEEIDKALQS
ncbi:MAG: thioredoxin domain-containing protein [Candidatus Paceibacterota bacterium]